LRNLGSVSDNWQSQKVLFLAEVMLRENRHCRQRPINGGVGIVKPLSGRAEVFFAWFFVRWFCSFGSSKNQLQYGTSDPKSATACKQCRLALRRHPMAKLVYSMMVSLDGYVAELNGNFDWGHIDEEIHRFANEEQRRHGTEIYGRRMYETMMYWETADQMANCSAVEREFALIWQSTDKIVISSSLNQVSSQRTQLLRTFDPEQIRQLKTKEQRDIAISGPTLAAAFIRDGLVDEYGIYYLPVVTGGGTPFFKDLDRRLDLKLVDEHPFHSGVRFMRYAPRQ
jgi:dihydrofolate reductase